jgi:hypothetical protein
MINKYLRKDYVLSYFHVLQQLIGFYSHNRVLYCAERTDLNYSQVIFIFNGLRK